MRKIIIWTLVVGAFLGVLLLAKPDKSQSEASGQTPLAAAEKFHDFGIISMKKGKVTHTYTIKNTDNQPTTITKLYTSCMCTTAELTAGAQRAGPFGMQGHGGTIPEIAITLAPNEEAQVKAVFDPAAHGSAGVGDIRRSVFVSSKSNPNLELTFKATVRP